MSKKEIKENWTLGISRDVIEMSKKAVGTPKLGMGAKGRVNTARIYFICRREWTLRPVNICDAERILSGFKLDSFRLSLVLHLLGHFLHFWKGRTLAYVVSQFTVLLPVSFPPARFSDWHAAVPPIGERCDPLGTELHQTIKNDFTDQGEGILLGVIPKEADEHKKANQPKWKTKLTNKQPNEKPFAPVSRMNCYWSFLFLLWLLVPQHFWSFLCFLISWFSLVSSRIIPPPSLASTALWLQVAHPRVELTALQCTKRAS